ncbi:hypothetical protein D3C86_1885580 [compost metagenome]
MWGHSGSAVLNGSQLVESASAFAKTQPEPGDPRRFRHLSPCPDLLYFSDSDFCPARRAAHQIHVHKKNAHDQARGEGRVQK